GAAADGAQAPEAPAGGGTAAETAVLGLGLEITRRLVELHGGAVLEVREGPGIAPRFAIQLPVFDAPALAPGDAPRSGAIALGGIRVLVVDDDPDAREMIALALAEAGAWSVAVGSAADAMAEFEREMPDLL